MIYSVSKLRFAHLVSNVKFAWWDQMIRWSTFSAQSSFASSSLSSSSYLPYPNLSDSSQVVYLYHHLFYLVPISLSDKIRWWMWGASLSLSSWFYLVPISLSDHIRWWMWGASLSLSSWFYLIQLSLSDYQVVYVRSDVEELKQVWTLYLSLYFMFDHPSFIIIILIIISWS